MFWLAVFLDCRAEYAFLEPLIEFLAVLVRKLSQKQLIGKGLFSILLGDFPKFFGPNLGTRNAKNPFGPFKVPNSNQKTVKLKKLYVIQMASAGLKGRWGKNTNVSKKLHKHPIII